MTKGFMIVPVEIDDTGEMRETERPAAIYPLDDIDNDVSTDVAHGERRWALFISVKRMV